MAYELEFFCRSGKLTGDEALDKVMFLDAP